ncbi:uncharacterized protein PG986_014042 [Apiospora aurea]|uniref:S-adenosyl-L-methionine-dependent methyltransferase n=1 Tax=Apiospora aurea TaxID=335848 RepID=A0ABR1PRV0_9PEZI
MGSSGNASTSTDPLFTKELPPAPRRASPAGRSRPLHWRAHTGADAEAADGAVITGAENFWPSVDTDDSDTPPEGAPGSPVERERNELQHRLLLEIFQGKLHLAPVRDPTVVLDLAKQHPGSKVLGVDLEPIPLQPEVPNCRFQVMNITDAWTFQLQFDFVHLRMLGELPPLSVIDSLYENLAPGGWAEFTEWVQVLQCPNHSVEGTAFERWDRAYRRALSKLGRPATFPYHYKGLLKKAGFRRVHVRKYAVPLNAWPNSKSLQRIGSMTATNYLSVIEILSRDLFVHVLGWTAQESDALIRQVRTDLQEPNIHSFYTLYGRFSIPFPYPETLADRYKSLTVYAQKPRG